MLANQNNSEFIAPCGQELSLKDNLEIGLTTYLDALLAKCIACKSFHCLNVDAHINNKGAGEVGAIYAHCDGTHIEISNPNLLTIEP